MSNPISPSDTVAWWQFYTAARQYSEELTAAFARLMEAADELPSDAVKPLRPALDRLRDDMITAHNRMALGAACPDARDYRDALADQARSPLAVAALSSCVTDTVSILQVDGATRTRATFTVALLPPPTVGAVRLYRHVADGVDRLFVRQGETGYWWSELGREHVQISWKALISLVPRDGVAFDATAELDNPEAQPWQLAGFHLGQPGVARVNGEIVKMPRVDVSLGVDKITAMHMHLRGFSAPEDNQ